MAATQHAQQLKNDSQTYLTTALFQLLATKELQQITVTELVKRAGVSRMAFYRNYQTLDDLLLAYFEPQMTRLFDLIMRPVPTNVKMDQLATYFDQFSAMLTLATKRHYEYLIQQLFNENMARYYQNQVTPLHLSVQQAQYWTTFMSNGVYGIWRTWLLNRDTATLTEIHDLLALFQNATAQALGSATSSDNGFGAFTKKDHSNE
jgi:AcrR family transcriptional regulator